MSKVMDHIVYHCPSEALNKLEEISYLLKHEDTVKIEEFLKTNEMKPYSQPASEETKSATNDFLKSAGGYFKVRDQEMIDF